MANLDSVSREPGGPDRRSELLSVLNRTTQRRWEFEGLLRRMGDPHPGPTHGAGWEPGSAR